MAISGSWSVIPRCEKGGLSLVDHDYANQLIDAVNALAQPRINPTSNTVGFTMSRNQAMWDFSGLVNALANVVTRLDSASANANCVGNTVTFTFHI